MTGPRIGSRSHKLLSLKPGEHCFFETYAGNVGRLMMQISTDIQRSGLTGEAAQRHLIAIDPATREVFDLVRVSRFEHNASLTGGSAATNGDSNER